MPPLDNDVINLAKAIRQVESNNKPVTPQEGSGFGGASRYQYSHKTWKEVAKKYLGDENAQLTLENENKATYYRIKEWKDQGKTPAQIASMWNAGEDDPDAHTGVFNSTGTSSVGVNEYGVKYDVPGYVQKVRAEYEKIKAGGQGSPLGNTMPQNPNQINPMAGVMTRENQPPAPVPQTPPKEEEPQPEEEKSFLRKAAEFVAPVLEEKERTPLQWVGDIGMTALNVVPAVGAAKLGLSALRAAPKLLGGAGALSKVDRAADAATAVTKSTLSPKNIGIGLGTGYGMDVAGSLSEGETSAKDIFTPGMGTILGGATGGLIRTPAKTQVTKAAQDLIPDLPFKASVGRVGKGGLEKEGILGRISQPVSASTYRTTESVLRHVPNYNKLGTYTEKLNAVNAANRNLAETLSREVIENGDDIIYPFKELNKKMVSLEAPIQIRADATQMRQYNIARKAALEIAKNNGGKISGLFNARKQFDELVEREFPTLYDRSNAPMRQAITDIRNVMNDTIEDALPNVKYKEALREQTELFRARDALAPKAFGEEGTTSVDRFMQRHPVASGVLKQILPVGVAGGVGAGVTNWLLKD